MNNTSLVTIEIAVTGGEKISVSAPAGSTLREFLQKANEESGLQWEGFDIFLQAQQLNDQIDSAIPDEGDVITVLRQSVKGGLSLYTA